VADGERRIRRASRPAQQLSVSAPKATAAGLKRTRIAPVARFRDMARTPFWFLSSRSQKEELLAEYVIREHHRGRDLDEILADTYVTNRCSSQEIARLLDRPDVVHAVGEDVLAARRTAPRSTSP
jgi:hypothetical protein